MESMPLADLDRELRAKYPDLFARVDAIKAQPGWEEFATGCGESSSRAAFDHLTWVRCAICDEHFVSENGARFCSSDCRARNRAEQRRAATLINRAS